jgi:hypothetical protein
MSKKLGETQSCSRHFGEQNILLPLLEIERYSVHPTCSPVTKPATLLTEMYTEFWLGNLKERNRMEDPGVGRTLSIFTQCPSYKYTYIDRSIATTKLPYFTYLVNQYAVKPGYNDISLCDTSSIISNTVKPLFNELLGDQNIFH